MILEQDLSNRWDDTTVYNSLYSDTARSASLYLSSTPGNEAATLISRLVVCSWLIQFQLQFILSITYQSHLTSLLVLFDVSLLRVASCFFTLEDTRVNKISGNSGNLSFTSDVRLCGRPGTPTPVTEI